MIEVMQGDEWCGRDFTGQRVGVLASGADAARIVPAVARTARAVKVFQEHPDWVLPPLPRPVRTMVALAPGVRDRVGRAYLRLSVPDAWTRRLLTPDGRSARPATVTSARYYRALERPDCTLVTWPVYAIVPGGVRTAEGIEHRLDCLIIAQNAAMDRGVPA